MQRRHSTVVIAVVMLTSATWACVHRPDASRIEAGSRSPRGQVLYPPLDVLLPPNARRDSAAVVAQVFQVDYNMPIPSVVCVGSPAKLAPGVPRQWDACAWAYVGQVFLKRLAPGNYLVHAQAIGFTAAEKVIRLRAGHVDTLTIYLHTKPVRY